MSRKEPNLPPSERGMVDTKPPPPPPPPPPLPSGPIPSQRALRVPQFYAFHEAPPGFSPAASYTIEFRHEETGRLYRATGVAYQIVEEGKVTVREDDPR
jgi:hypothetical protein